MKLTGKNIVVRDWKIEDIEKYLYWSKPEHKWHSFNEPYFPLPTEDRIQERANKIKEDIERNSFETPRTWMVIADKDTDKYVGTVSSYWKSIETNWICLGIGICDESM